LEGKGLHSGLNLKITFNPAPEDYGYRIRRTDVFGQPIIDAVAENVIGTQRGTVLSDNGVQVGTVEHALAALYGCEIDNCLIEVDGPEFPIFDGSSIVFVSKIKETGVREQKAARKYIHLKRKRIRVTDADTGSEIILLPGDTLKIQSRIRFDSLLLRQQSACLDNISDFVKEFASSRTFVFVKEIEQLLQKNLIKGGDLDNAIVIYDTPISQEDYDRLANITRVRHKDAKKLGYIMNKPLIYENEPARHKLLDILGDIALTGAFIKGTIIATCPGHKINTSFAKAIREYYLSQIQKKEKKTIKEELQLEPALSGVGNFYWNKP
jgi:UDP-3-O-[3-hydroxymyristoyl] N-acetylglucosamine deacetylase/3-hydroxyacyl-[acyl-carrier-protein] dehydratase